MRTKFMLTAEDVRTIADGCRSFAESRRWDITFAIVDDAGFPLYLERLDGAGPMTATIALAKARTAALGKRTNAEWEERIKTRPALMTFPYEAMVQGGVPIVHEGQYVGAVGVSGRASDEDEAVAQAGIAKLR